MRNGPKQIRMCQMRWTRYCSAVFQKLLLFIAERPLKHMNETPKRPNQMTGSHNWQNTKTKRQKAETELRTNERKKDVNKMISGPGKMSVNRMWTLDVAHFAHIHSENEVAACGSVDTFSHNFRFVCYISFDRTLHYFFLFFLLLRLLTADCWLLPSVIGCRLSSIVHIMKICIGLLNLLKQTMGCFWWRARFDLLFGSHTNGTITSERIVCYCENSISSGNRKMRKKKVFFLSEMKQNDASASCWRKNDRQDIRPESVFRVPIESDILSNRNGYGGGGGSIRTNGWKEKECAEERKIDMGWV